MQKRTTSSYKGTRSRGQSRGRSFSSLSRGRPSFGRRAGAPRARRSPYRGGRGFSAGKHIHTSRFIHKAVIEGQEEVFTPVHRFSDFKVNETLKNNIAQKGYLTPTPIQDVAIPLLLEGKDIVGIAHTGTGKTGAFLIPLIDKVLRLRSEQILIMVPTRELALQIEDELKGFAAHLKIRSISCVGGARIGGQIRAMRNTPHFVIGTPGRLMDLIERRVLDLSKFSTVVLDEADRMLDMGFIADMKQILSYMPSVRHTLFFSATLSRDIEALIGGFLVNPSRVSVKTGETVASVEQDIVRVHGGKDKVDILHNLLVQPGFSKVLVFGRTKHGVEKLARILAQRGLKAESIHGNKNQNNRQRVLALFKNSRVQVLVATDVAARGIDVADISHVINYDLPNTYEDYVHRIGRTARAGKRGMALTFVE